MANFGRKVFFMFSVYMILTDGNISQDEIVETSQFVFKATNIGLLVEKYNFCNSNQILSFLKITQLNIPRRTSIFIKQFNKLIAEIKPS